MSFKQGYVSKALRLAIVYSFVTASYAQTCADVPLSGCSGNGPIHGGDFQFFVPFPVIASCRDLVGDLGGGWETAGSTNGCDIDPGTFDINDCLDEQTSVPGPCVDWFVGCCTTGQTVAPTDAPSVSPTSAPTSAPSTSPSTLPPTDAPSVSPTPQPTDAPSSSPTTSGPTTSPVAAPLGFFDVEENIYIVAGAGGGGLLALAALIAVVRSRRSGSSAAATAMEPKAGGKKLDASTDIFDWEKHIDKKSGEVYFFNPKTGESRWDPPEVNAPKP